ncbi:MAG: hypothetical protein AAF138_09205 [Planctomycetota bacterium]
MSDASQHSESGAMRAFLPGLVLGLVLGLGVGAFVMPFIESGGSPDLSEQVAAGGSASSSERDAQPETEFEAASDGLTNEQILEALEEYRQSHDLTTEQAAPESAPDAGSDG